MRIAEIFLISFCPIRGRMYDGDLIFIFPDSFPAF